MPPESPVQVAVTSRVAAEQIAPASRWSFQVYAGYDARAGAVTGAGVTYVVSPSIAASATVEYRWQTQDINGRLFVSATF